MKIVTVLHSHGLGGAERHALGLMCALRDAGHDMLFAGPSDSWLAEQILAEGMAVEHLPMHGFFDLASMLRLTRTARRFKADILHGHLTRGAHYAGIAGRLGGIPCVATAHSTNAGKHFGRARRIIAASSAVRAFLLERGYPADRIERVHHGLDVPAMTAEARQAFRAHHDIPEDSIIFGMVARFVPDKGQDTALRAFARAGQPGCLLLVGDDSTPWGQSMRKLAKELALDDRVRFIGQQDDVFPALAAMDAFLAPSRREALGLSLIESAGMGLPLLGSHVGGIPEIIEPEQNGLLLPPDDIPAWSMALQRLYADAGLRRRMGDAARATYEQRFSTTRMMRATENIYRRAVEGAT
ncbi:MAG: glycosyltransferase family 4 protein [Halothiobacillaceae bacterium]|nr:MAG: glycosyltransferase family 4 protein [Halothiobacillaceae bacterium]